MTERLRQLVEKAQVRPETYRKVREIIQLHHEALVEAMCGTSELAPEVVAQIQAAGIPRWSGPAAVEGGVDLGILMAATKDPFQDEMTYADFRKRLGRRESPLSYAEAVAHQDAKAHAARYCRGLGNTVDEQTQSAIVVTDEAHRAEIERRFREETAEAIDMRETAQQLKQRLGRVEEDWTRDLHRVAATEIHNAMQAGRGAAIARDYGDDARVAKRPNSDACAACLDAYLDDDGKPRIFKLSEIRTASNARDPATGKARKQSAWVPTLECLHPHCFLPGTVVQGRVELVTRALYSGEAVEIRTAAGHHLSVTPNHPIPTADGRWVAAGQISQGDYLLRYRDRVEDDGVLAGSGAPSRAGNEYQAPTRVEDLFDALAERCLTLRLDVAPVDFHGDAFGFQGQVEVVGAEGILANCENPGDQERLGYSPLSEPLVGTVPVPLVTGSSSRLLGFRHDTASRRRPSGAAALLHSGSIGFHAGPRNALLIGNAAYLDTCVSEPAGEASPRGANFSRELQDRFPSRVAPDEVIEVRNIRFSGHVYDLQSPLGWIVASTLVASNCRCQVLHVPQGWGFDDEGRLAPKSLLEKVATQANGIRP